MKRNVIILLVLAALLLDSCAYKRIIYLQDMDTVTEYEAKEAPDAMIRTHDRLNILVTCKTPALAAPFNISTTAVAVSEETGRITTAGQNGGGSYLVDKFGNINFPVLGEMHVAGMTLKELEQEIVRQIEANNYIREPMVVVEFQNFSVVVLGEIGGKGIKTINSGSVNMFELIAMCGDLTRNSQRDDIWVIRTEGGRRKVYSINMLTKDCFDSPVFYLQQDDMVYVKPRKNVANEVKQNWFQYTGFLLSVLSTTSTVLYWTRLGR